MKLSHFLISAYVTLSLLPQRVFAQSDIDKSLKNLGNLDYSLGGQRAGNDVLDPTAGLTNAIDDLIGRLPIYLSAIGFLAFLYSGAMYVFAFGDASKQESAKKNITWAVTGMIVLALTGVIVKFAYGISTQAGKFQSIKDIPGLQ